MIRPAPNRARRHARLLSVGGALGGFFTVLGAWFAIRGPHAPEIQGRSGAAELLMVCGLFLASFCGVVATLRVGAGVILKLDADRQQVRLKDPK